ncbi:YihD family protein [Psychromonas sp. CD1]|uniref:YihD family protein n=1 Tax=Psychromonas sp. CD1 TaxID=1979839 RepID=UPI000B9BA6A6|nr:YihD family protein [Psychromonas sp. CD1]
MHTHRINEILELLQPYWLKNKELSLLEILALISKESSFTDPISQLSDEVIIYQLKMDQIGKDDVIPGIKKDFENDFKNALLKARGVLK